MYLGPASPSWSSWPRLTVLMLTPLAVSYELASLSDILLLFLLAYLRNWELSLKILQSYGLRSLFGGASRMALTFGLFQIVKWWKRKSGRPGRAIPADNNPRPLFFPSRTTHTRFFPKSHSFSYSYLLVGIPVGWRGSVGGMLAADQGARRPALEAEDVSGWYTIDAADYLNRGYGHLGLDGKLKRFLIDEGENHEEYPYAYLVTAPRFMGYSFNPVSFWYLYSSDRKLAAMILEVNNTFDERHLYFLKPPQNPSASVNAPEEVEVQSKDLTENGYSTSAQMSSKPSQNPSASVHAPEEPEVQSEDPLTENGHSASAHISSKPTRFSESWAKEFHVSPFNSRKGSYSLAAYDPLYPSMTGRGPIKNTITLLSSKHHPKLVARIVSDGAAADPSGMSFRQKLIFLSLWWWVGFVTFPRIVREAGKLFFRRKLHVWFRPEPLKNSISRNADSTEQLLEKCFQNYLRHLVEIVKPPLGVKYTPAGIKDTSEEVIISPLTGWNSLAGRILEIRVLTPIFYSRFVHYAHDLEALLSEFNENGTVWISRPSLLPGLLRKKPLSPQNIFGWDNYLSFKLIQYLRRRPPQIGGTKRTAGQAKARDDVHSDIRTFRSSAMDGYFLTHGSLADRRDYRTQVLKVLISDRVAFGNVEIFTAGVFLLKCGISWIIVRNFLTLNM